VNSSILQINPHPARRKPDGPASNESVASCGSRLLLRRNRPCRHLQRHRQSGWRESFPVCTRMKCCLLCQLATSDLEVRVCAMGGCCEPSPRDMIRRAILRRAGGLRTFRTWRAKHSGTGVHKAFTNPLFSPPQTPPTLCRPLLCDADRLLRLPARRLQGCVAEETAVACGFQDNATVNRATGAEIYVVS